MNPPKFWLFFFPLKATIGTISFLDENQSLQKFLMQLCFFHKLNGPSSRHLVGRTLSTVADNTEYRIPSVTHPSLPGWFLLTPPAAFLPILPTPPQASGDDPDPGGPYAWHLPPAAFSPPGRTGCPSLLLQWHQGLCAGPTCQLPCCPGTPLRMESHHFGVQALVPSQAHGRTSEATGIGMWMGFVFQTWEHAVSEKWTLPARLLQLCLLSDEAVRVPIDTGKLVFCFNWRIVAWQCCGLCLTSTRISHMS